MSIWYLQWMSGCMCQWIGWALVRIMAWLLFSAKPFCERILGYCQLDPSDKNCSVISIKIRSCSLKKIRLEMPSAKTAAFLSKGGGGGGGGVNNHYVKVFRKDVSVVALNQQCVKQNNLQTKYLANAELTFTEYDYYWSKVNILNVNCVLARSMHIWHTNGCCCECVKGFWGRKCLDLRGTRTPNLRIHAECSNNNLSHQGQTFAVLCFFDTGSGGIDIFKMN